MKTLTTLLTAAVLLTSCGNKYEVSCEKSELTSGNHSECVCQLLNKKNSVNQKTKHSKNGLIIFSPKISSFY